MFTYGIILPREVSEKSELKGKNPSESMKILMLNEIRPFILTQAENPNSKD